jgi:hypothetical protein
VNGEGGNYEAPRIEASEDVTEPLVGVASRN